jgi:uncharacterized protein (DUF983 family)
MEKAKFLEWVKKVTACKECGREFNLSDYDDAQEFYYGHDCEA